MSQGQISPSFYQPTAQELSQVRDMLISFPQRTPYPWLSQLLGHVLGEGGGKMLRPTLSLLIGKCLGYRAHLHVPMAVAVELLHTATLVHDDAVDDSPLRRGKATLNVLWDRTTSVLVGDYLFSLAAELAANTGNMEVIKLFAATLMNVCNGELQEKSFSHRIDVTREQYFSCIDLKTASLFSAATEAAALLSQAPAGSVQAMKNYGHHLGMAFQVVDDILDFVGEEREMGKPVGSDLLQGTLTLPALLLVERCPGGGPVAALFQGQDAEANLEKAIALIRDSSIIEECYAVAQGFQAQACQSLQVLADSPFRQALLDMADYSVQRQR